MPQGSRQGACDYLLIKECSCAQTQHTHCSQARSHWLLSAFHNRLLMTPALPFVHIWTHQGDSSLIQSAHGIHTVSHLSENKSSSPSWLGSCDAHLGLTLFPGHQSHWLLGTPQTFQENCSMSLPCLVLLRLLVTLSFASFLSCSKATFSYVSHPASGCNLAHSPTGTPNSLLLGFSFPFPCTS